MAGVVQSMELAQFSVWLDKQGRDMDFGPALKQCSLLLIKATKENFANQRGPTGQPWPPIKGRVRGGGKALRDTGRLMASITAKPQPDELVVGTNLEYAGIHQYGGTITPKKGKALTIPQTVQALRAGSPRNMPGLFLIWKRGARSGGLYSGQGGARNLQFLLVPSVTIPARPYLGWNEDLAQGCAQILADHWEKMGK